MESTVGKGLKNGSTTKQFEKVNRVSSGAQVCESCRSRQELPKECSLFICKIGFDTAENEPLAVWRRLNSFFNPYSLHNCAGRAAGISPPNLCFHVLTLLRLSFSQNLIFAGPPRTPQFRHRGSLAREWRRFRGRGYRDSTSQTALTTSLAFPLFYH